MRPAPSYLPYGSRISVFLRPRTCVLPTHLLHKSTHTRSTLLQFVAWIGSLEVSSGTVAICGFKGTGGQSLQTTLSPSNMAPDRGRSKSALIFQEASRTCHGIVGGRVNQFKSGFLTRRRQASSTTQTPRSTPWTQTGGRREEHASKRSDCMYGVGLAKLGAVPLVHFFCLNSRN